LLLFYGPMDKQTFSKDARIRKKRDYFTVYQQGIRNDSRHFIVITRRNQSGFSRLGITVSKKVGDAVKRNRVKRLLREFFRLHKTQFSPSQDIVIIAKKGIPDLTYQDVRRELESLFTRISDA
jgi:ribonuclease P protein component